MIAVITAPSRSSRRHICGLRTTENSISVKWLLDRICLNFLVDDMQYALVEDGCAPSVMQ